MTELLNILTSHCIVLYKILVRSAFLSVVLWLGWNYGVAKFWPVSHVDWLDAIVILVTVQILLIFSLRPSHPTQFVPIYCPLEKWEAPKEEKAAQDV